MDYNGSFLPPGDYVTYLRKSRKDLELEARGVDDTLSRHRRILAEYAAAHDLHVAAVYHEVRSGDSITDRPEMQRLLREVESGRWRGVLVMEVERLARGDSIDQGIVARAFKLSETLIVTPNTVFDPTREYDEEAFEFNLFMARREYKAIRRRMTMGMAAAKREGRFIAHEAPYGYERYKLQGRGWSLRQIPEQAEAVRMIFDMFVHGHNRYDIVARLNSLHIPSPRGGEWVVSTISSMVRNPHYAGYIPHHMRPQTTKIEDGEVRQSRPRNPDYTLYNGLHEAIITEEVWQKAKEIIAKSKEYYAPRVPGNRTQKNPLCGLLICDQCGKKMIRRPATCTTSQDQYLCTTKNCPTVGHGCDDLERLVIDALQKFLSSIPIGKKQVVVSADSELRAIAQIDKKLAALAARMERAFSLVEDGTYTRAEFRQRQAALRAEQNQLAADRAALQKTADRIADENAARADLAPKIKELLAAYDYNAPAADRCKMLKTVLSRIDYHKTTRMTRAMKPTDLSVTLHPLISPHANN